MAGDEQGHELVAELLVGHRRAVLVAGLEQHREHVVALLVGVAALVDELEHEPVDSSRRSTKPAIGPNLLKRRSIRGDGLMNRVIGLLAVGEHRAEPGAQGVEALAGVEAEDGAQDHLEGQPLHPGVQLDRGLGAPGGHLTLGHRRDQSLEPFIRSPWNAGSISLRCSMWESPSSRMTELRPTIGSSVRAPSPGWRTSGGAVKISLTSSGSVSITNGGVEGRRRVKRLP